MTTAAETVQRMLDEQRTKLEELEVGSAAAGYIHIRIDTLEKVLKELTPQPANKNLQYAVVIRSADPQDRMDGELVNLAATTAPTAARRNWTTDRIEAEHWQRVQTLKWSMGYYRFELVETDNPEEWKP